MTRQLADILSTDAPAVAGAVGTVTATPVVEQSPTVLDVDRWTVRQGERLANEWLELGVATDSPESPDLANVAADALATCMDVRPEPASNPQSKSRAEYWSTLLQSPELARVRQHSQARPAVAKIAALSLAQEWQKYAETNPEPEPNPDNPDGQPDPDSPEQTQADIARIASTRAAIRGAEKAAEQAAGLAQGLGLGTETDADAQAIAALYETVANDPTLRAIIEAAGRWTRAATAIRQTARVDSATGEIVGVTVSADIPNILPTELAMLAGYVPALATLYRAQFADGQLASYRRRMREPAAQGPIVLTLDESSSMDGDRIVAAKAFALTVAQIARSQGRPFMFHAFAGTAQLRTVKDSDAPAALLAWLTRQLGGGTIPNGPLAEAPAHWPHGTDGAQADHIIVTDAAMAVPPDLAASYTAWAKSRNVRTWLVGIGVPDVGDMAQVADSVTVVPNLSPDGLKAVLVAL